MVKDGTEVLEITKSYQFDLILMDIQMSRMNGCETTRMLRKAGVITPILALTAGAMKGDRAKCLDAGCDEYLTKPIDKEKLLEVIKRFIKQPAV